MKILLKNKINIIIVVIFFPYSVFASNVYIDTKHSDFFVGDTVMFSVRVDSENENINTVEGSVILDYSKESVSLVDINTSGSEFSLWPSKPLPSDGNTSISFTAGTPLVLNSKDAVIFNIVLRLQEVGQVTLAPKNFSVYLHDGKGTKDNISVKNLVIDVLPKKLDSQSVNDWNNLTLDDKISPEPFIIHLGQEGSVFDGKKFLSFSTTDKQSGISYYEVIENNQPSVRSDGTYILQEQNKLVKVTVIAYDSAGNTRESVYSPTYNIISYPIVMILLGVIIFIIILVIIVKKMNK